MKPYRILIVVLCIAFLFTGCAKTPLRGTVSTTYAIESAVQDTIDTAKRAIDNGEYETAYALLSDVHSQQATELLEHFAFVPVTRKTAPDSGDPDSPYTIEYVYDDDGNIVKTEQRANDGHIAFLTTYTLDENGYCLKNITTRDNREDAVTEYEFDNRGRYSRITVKYANDEKEQYIYQDGRLSEHYMIFGPGASSYTQCFYDPSTGLLLKDRTSALSTDEFGNTVIDSSDWTITDYEYDEHGNLIKQTKHVSDTPVVVLFEYKDGRLIRRTLDNENGERSRYSYIYDDYGNQISVTTTYFDGYQSTETTEWVLKYYENGVPQNIRAVIDTVTVF